LAAATVTSPIWIDIGAFLDQLPCEVAIGFDAGGASIEQAASMSETNILETDADTFMNASEADQQITDEPTIPHSENSCQTKKGGFETRPYQSDFYFATFAWYKFLRMRSGQAFAAKSSPP
jgi:hypothetical protein